MATAPYSILYHDMLNWEDKAAGLIDIIWYRDANHRMSYDAFSDSLYSFYFSSSTNEETDDMPPTNPRFPSQTTSLFAPLKSQTASHSTALFFDIQAWMLDSPAVSSPSSPLIGNTAPVVNLSLYCPPSSRYALFPSLYHGNEQDMFARGTSEPSKKTPSAWLSDILKRVKVSFGVLVTALYYMDRAAKLKSGSAVHYCQNCRMDLLDCNCWQRKFHSHDYSPDYMSSMSYPERSHHPLATRNAVFLVNTTQMRNFPFSYKMYSYSYSTHAMLPERPVRQSRTGICSADVDVYQRRRYRLFAIVFIMIACKYHQDRHYSNQVWAELSGFPLQLVNVSERAALCALGFDLRIDKNVNEYCRWYEYCRKLLYTVSEPNVTGMMTPEPSQSGLYQSALPLADYSHFKKLSSHSLSHSHSLLPPPPCPYSSHCRSMTQSSLHSHRSSSISEKSRLRRNSKSRRHF